MAIMLECPGCGKRYKLKDEMAGKQAKCACGNVITVPAPRDAGNRSTVPAQAVGPDSDSGTRTAEYVPVELVPEPSPAPVKLPGFFFFKARLTLASDLTPEAAWARLAEVLPRFEVRTGRPIPRVGFSLSRYYGGSIREGSFRLSGPYRLGTRIAALDVKGSIEGTQNGSLIHLTVYPAAAIAPCFLICLCGIITGGLVAILDRIVVWPLVVVAGSGVLGAMFYAFGLLRAQTALAPLVNCLQGLFTAQPAR